MTGSGSNGRALSRRALNRALLERQLLLRRAELSVSDTVERLGGLQAQTTTTWYTGLWTRLVDFDPHEPAGMLEDRRLVRIALMRSTIHLVTARDCLALRAVVEPVLDRSMKGNFGRHLVGLPRAELVSAGRTAVDEQPRTLGELGRVLAQRWPDRDPASLAQGVRAWVPLVQVPPRGVWGRSGQARHTSVENWLGAAPGEPDPAALVRRYLAAFGPASIADAQTWSGLTRLREVFDVLRPELATFRDDAGRELFDLPDAPRPDPDTPAPPRFLYDYDNLLLSHADRSRVVSESYRSQNFPSDGAQPAAVLIDGFTAATWTLTRDRRAATLTVRPFGPLSPDVQTAVAEEGERLLAFLGHGADTRAVSFQRSVSSQRS